MGNNIEKRRKAFNYIVNQAKKLHLDISKIPYADTNISGYISLEEIIQLKEGVADPSETLIKQLKELFRHVSSEEDIYNNLIKPFKPGNN